MAPAAFADNLVTLSGHVYLAPGVAAVGDGVAGFGVSDTTDANGYFELHVFPGQSLSDVGLLDFSPSAATVAARGGLSNLHATTDLFSVWPAGRTGVDFTWPAPATALVTVEDATGVALSGILVTGNNGGRVSGALPAGTPVSTSYDPPIQTGNTCTTNDAGQCAFPNLLGIAPTFYTSRFQLVPGDPSYPTVGAGGAIPPITIDPTLYVFRFASLALLTSAGQVAGAMVAIAPDGVSFSNVSVQDVGASLPSGAAVLTGALSYEVDGLAAGGSVDVTLKLPPGSNPTGVFKFQNGAYIDVSSIATIAGDFITLHLSDGGLGDADGLANGVIIDPVIPALLHAPGAPTIGQAAPGNASASVTFTAPAGNGGSPILDYTATCTSSNGGLPGSATGSASPLSVTSMTNDKTYTCIVTARNAVGSSDPSAMSNAVTPASKTAAILTYTGPTSSKPGAAITLTATIRTASGVAISRRKVSFVLNGTTYTATSNNSGFASKDATAPAIAGIYPIAVAFAGDATYAPASTTGSLADRWSTTLTYTGSTTALAGSSITLTAALQTSAGARLAGRTVTFSLNGLSYATTTNDSGIATTLATAPTIAGSFSIGVTFAGDPANGPSTASASLKVAIRTVVTYTGPTSAVHGQSIALTAKLVTNGGTAISDGIVTFALNGRNYSATTNASGIASVTVTAPTKRGTYPIIVSFAGDATYAASKSTFNGLIIS